MKPWILILLCGWLLVGCGSSQSAGTTDDPPEEETLEQKNRVALTLLTRIRQHPGIMLRRGVPVLARTQTDLTGSVWLEPLYVLNGYIVGNSFRDLNILVQSVDVKEIEILTGPDTSIYGSRGGAGVILITTYQ